MGIMLISRLGLMQYSWVPDPIPDEQAFECMLAALEAGSNTWSTATFYGMPPNEWANLALIGRFFKKYPEHIGKVQLVVKGGLDNMMPTSEYVRDGPGIREETDNTASK